MTDRLVCDASAIVALLCDSGPDGRWVTGAISGAVIIAPTLMPFEASNILRRQGASGQISADQAAQAHADLLDLTVEEWPFELLGARVWELRQNMSSYDASYVAVAELVRAPLITLDRRLSRAPMLRCEVRTP